MTAKRLALLAVVLAAAGCGGGTSGAVRTGHTVTFKTAGTFAPLVIAGKYSVAGCAHDSRVIVQSAQMFYEHSTTAPGPADLYYYDLREGYAHFQADDCTSKQLGDVVMSRLPAAQRTWLLHNLPSTFTRVFRAAIATS